MPFSSPIEPIPDDDEAIRRAVQASDVPPLLAAVAYVTGDLSLLRDEYRPDPEALLLPDGGISPSAQVAARELAAQALMTWRDGGCVPAAHPDADDLQRLLDFVSGHGAPMDRYLQLFREELALEGEDLRSPDWQAADLAPDRPFRVVVIGAGMSGLLASHRLQQAGVDHVVLEKDRELGGTWFENTYPGCRVDVPNAFYSYSFAQRDDWPQHFSTQEVLLDYFRRVADELGLRDHIRFGVEVERITWHEERAAWSLALRTADGPESLEAHAVISAVGQLNQPLYPDIEGRDRFAGPSFHSARWDHDVDLAGKRVAVVGTGASAVQFVPPVADEAAEVVVFQRTPPWLIPTPDYHEEVSAEQRWLFRHVPTYAQWYRFWIFWRNCEGLLPFVTVDPAWDDGGRSVSAQNDMLRLLFTTYLEAELHDRPDLLARVVPTYPVAAKRVIRDNGIWPATLKRDDVELVTEPIAEITPTGVRTADGVDHDVDVVIYGTGFQASRFLTPMQVVGRGGVDLHQQWDGDARAYLGVTIPGFPNFFCLYGPNTNIVINGSIIYFSECEVRYVLGCLRLLLEKGHGAIECRRDVHDAFNAEIDAANRGMAWGASEVNSWYKNAKGRVAQNWPFSLLEYWERTVEPDPADYELG